MIGVSRLLSMRIAPFLLGSVLLLCCVPVGHAQRMDGDDLEDSLNAVIDGALAVHITARIIDEGENQEVWNMNLTRFTIGGRSVTVQLEGSNIRVLAEFTPYWESEDQLLLVAQGQTWIGIDEADGDPEYRTAFTTLADSPLESRFSSFLLAAGAYRLTRNVSVGSISNSS